MAIGFLLDWIQAVNEKILNHSKIFKYKGFEKMDNVALCKKLSTFEFLFSLQKIILLTGLSKFAVRKKQTDDCNYRIGY